MMKSTMIKVLVTGAGGQLGLEFQEIARKSEISDIKFYFKSRGDFDVTDRYELEKLFDEIKPDYLINCAAYTKVDLAEDEGKEENYIVNADGMKPLVEVCNKYETMFVHFSTDYVYHIDKNSPLVETDVTQPKSEYAIAKKKGEDILIENANKYLIFRTSWVYSSYGHNFVKTIMRLINEKDNLRIVADQYGTPTYARDLAKNVFEIVQKLEEFSEVYGQYINQIYNYSNLGNTHWAEFAEKICEYAHSQCKIEAINSDQFVSKAQRPSWSVLSKDKIIKNFEIEIPTWEESLQKCVKLIQES